MMLIAMMALVLFPVAANAACGGSSPNLTAASVNRADVVDCITAAVDGDTITIPAGTATDWTSEVTISKAITLQGSGTCGTIIKDNIAANAELITMNLVANLTSKIKNIRFEGGTATSGQMIVIDAATNTLDDRRFVIENNCFYRVLRIYLEPNRAYGVIANNTFETTNASGAPIYLVHNNYTWADDRWADSDSHWGTDQFVFIEDNIFDKRQAFECSPSCVTRPIYDAQSGSRAVLRYNTVYCGYVEVHGTESPGRQRGGRSIEVYENTFDSTSCNSTGSTILGLRSGSALVYNNTAENWGILTSAVSFTNLRTSDNYGPFGIADGRNTFDLNDDANNPYVTGTVSSAGTLTMTDSGKSWTTNQWTGYILRNTTAPCNVPITSSNATNEQFTTSAAHGLSTGNRVVIKSHVGSVPAVTGHYAVTVVDSTTFTVDGVSLTTGGTGGYVSLCHASNSCSATSGTPTCSSVISSNTSTQLTFLGAQFPSNMSFSAGNTYEINKITEVFDQGGRGGGTDYNGSTTPTVTAATQSDDPVYEWGNTKNSGTVNLNPTIAAEYSLQVRANEHYFVDTVAPGYTAYTYPHPLRDGGSPPASPGNRRFSPAHNLRRAELPSWPVPFFQPILRRMYALLARW